MVYTQDIQVRGHDVKTKRITWVHLRAAQPKTISHISKQHNLDCSSASLVVIFTLRDLTTALLVALYLF